MLAKCLILGVLLVSLAAAVQSTGLEEPSFQPTSSQSAQPIQSNGSEEPTSSPIATATQSDDTCAEWKSRFGELNCCGTDYRTAKTFANSTECHTIRADYRRGCNIAGRCTAPNGGTQPGTQTTTTNPAQNPNNIQTTQEPSSAPISSAGSSCSTTFQCTASTGQCPLCSDCTSNGDCLSDNCDNFVCEEQR